MADAMLTTPLGMLRSAECGEEYPKLRMTVAEKVMITPEHTEIYACKRAIIKEVIKMRPNGTYVQEQLE
jgi:hypothetical protein